MHDLERARMLLTEGSYACVLCRADVCYTSRGKGISPMLDWIGAGVELKGFCAADIIVGKAAAMLFVHAGVGAVYGRVMSTAGKDYLTTHGVVCSYDILTERIVNRTGDGVCPMEQTVSQLEDPQAAYAALRRKRDEMRRKQ